MVVAKEFRRKTVALHLVKELYFLAMKLKLEKIIAKMMESQKRAIKIFAEIGFKKEATLKGHVKDLAGKNHNLVIMSHMVTTHWDELEDLIQGHSDDFSGDFAGRG
jgi:RimJ/RimL family protein N-acetyltransferase